MPLRAGAVRLFNCAFKVSESGKWLLFYKQLARGSIGLHKRVTKNLSCTEKITTDRGLKNRATKGVIRQVALFHTERAVFFTKTRGMADIISHAP